MAKQTQGSAGAARQRNDSTTSKMPHTWEEALKMWDAGESVPAFQVESDVSTQEDLWGAAFSILRGDTPEWDISHFTPREVDVVKSIVAVSQLTPWPQMISTHVHTHSPALMIRKPD